MQSAGQKYSIQLQLKEGGGSAVIRLRWSHACEPKAIIPKSQLYSSSAPNGLLAHYFSGSDFNTLVVKKNLLIH